VGVKSEMRKKKGKKDKAATPRVSRKCFDNEKNYRSLVVRGKGGLLSPRRGTWENTLSLEEIAPMGFKEENRELV